jgi:hypothetical protein
MSYKINNAAILIAMSIIALALVTTTSFNHYYTVFAVSKKSRSTGSDTNGVSTLGGISPSSSSATTPNSNTLTKKELSSFISCINTANKSGEGLTHKVVTNCLDTARGITSATASRTTTSSSSPSPAPSATLQLR